MKTKFFTILAIAGLMALSAAAQAQDKPTAPLGGAPAAGTEVSVDDFAYQLAYQRSFEAVLWSIAARQGSAKHVAGSPRQV